MSDRKEHWEKVYGNKSPLEVSWYQKEPTLSLQLIGNAELAPDAAIIDVGGGASLLVDKLCKAGYKDLTVLDVSARALEHARKRLTDKACQILWFEADVTRFEPPREYTLWHDRAVFHFLTDQADRESYVSVLRKALKPGGHLIIMAFALDGPLKCSGLETVQYDADKLIAELGSGFKLIETGYETHVTPTGNLQKMAYFYFMATPEISE